MQLPVRDCICTVTHKDTQNSGHSAFNSSNTGLFLTVRDTGLLLTVRAKPTHGFFNSSNSKTKPFPRTVKKPVCGSRTAKRNLVGLELLKKSRSNC